MRVLPATPKNRRHQGPQYNNQFGGQPQMMQPPPVPHHSGMGGAMGGAQWMPPQADGTGGSFQLLPTGDDPFTGLG
ncbi:Uu.00g067720.m01.CDS01 [Anthostomella pinea]|uniref:Uu.00g067720.m01.CDS01 n=1 Tax=Anthostomella pinea TaxID=933095 RepID=A0AAI8YL01_9PEZI|nr:Uu.00g067720.m01.CDS01 [Anthostomella pinea]